VRHLCFSWVSALILFLLFFFSISRFHPPSSPPHSLQVLNTSSDIIVIMLGTNDAKTTATGGPANWENDGKTGEQECQFQDNRECETGSCSS
jgi:hypothetical protein